MVRDSLTNVLNPVSSNASWVHQEMDSLTLWNAAIIEVDSVIISIADSLSDSTWSQELLDARDALLNKIQSVSDTLQGTQVNISAVVANNANNALTINSAIQPVAIYEANEQTVNDIYLRSLASDTFQYTGADIANISSIARQCPLEGGEAVYRARSLYLALVIDTVFDDRALCNANKSKKVDSTAVGKTQPQISIYPNPAKNEVTFLFINVSEPMLRLQIVNDMGQLINNETIATAGGAVNLNVSSFSEGVYHFSLYSFDKLIHEQTIVILR